MSAREFSEWIAYARLEPFGEERADLRAGIVASTIAAVNTPKGKRRPKPGDFMPEFDKQKPNERELGQKILSVFSMFPQTNRQHFDHALKEIDFDDSR